MVVRFWWDGKICTFAIEQTWVSKDKEKVDNARMRWNLNDCINELEVPKSTVLLQKNSTTRNSQCNGKGSEIPWREGKKKYKKEKKQRRRIAVSSLT